jgi:hypothetical protein
MKTKRTPTPPAAAPSKPISPELAERNRLFRIQKKRWKQQIRNGRPVARSLANEAREWLDVILTSGDGEAMYAAIATLHAMREYMRDVRKRAACPSPSTRNKP